jgi:tetratricopeptide (TPR) repeat protein
MARRSATWTAFETTGTGYDFSGGKLKKAWPRLHAGDAEPFPDTKRAAALLEAVRNPPRGHDPETLSELLTEAWRSFHQGNFQAAFEQGRALGPLGASVACKALAIHAAYLVDDEDEQLARFEQAAALAEDAIAALPGDANSHYRRAHALGRYSQGISIAKALKMGLAGKVRESLDTTLELAPKHAEAHTALAVYHAEIIAKVGSMIGGLTYGAKAAEAEKHIRQALKLTPEAPIVHVEHANVLLLLKGRKGEDEAADAYERATGLKPRDAMEELDAAYAAEQIE